MKELKTILDEIYDSSEDENKVIEYLFEKFKDFDDEEIVEIWEDYLLFKSEENCKIKKMQTGGGMLNSLPTNSVYRKPVEDLY